MIGLSRMGFYQRFVLPRLTDWAMRASEATRFRAQVVPAASGEVLEIGVGSGLNLPFYGPCVARLMALDPSAALLRMAQKRADTVHFPVTLVNATSECIPADGRSFDTVVTTWTLCTIPDPVAALKEMARVLRPDGVLCFVEHGRAPDRGVQRWQDRLNPVWRALTGGCNLNREVAVLLQTAGFTITKLENEYAKGPRPMCYFYHGTARTRPS
jgi:ubiquinone/menaquinone biosynthesis C-methylase UbiE